MKRLLTLLSVSLITFSGSAQPIICSGNPLTGIDGNAYDSVAATGPGFFGSVANSKDGKLFATNEGKLRYISASDFSVIDSMDISIGYFVGLQSNDTMFGLRPNGMSLLRFNTATKAVIDTLAMPGLYHSRVTERPMSKEVWISGAPIHVIDYTNAMNSTDTFALGTNINNVKFSSNGQIAYASSGVTNRIYIIDAVNKVVTDSIDFADSPVAFERSADNSKMFIAAPGKIRVYQTSNFDLIDSVNVTMPTMTMYRHPSRAEIWCVHHFDDSVSVFDANTHAVIDSIPVGGSPFFLAFGEVTSNVNEVHMQASAVDVFPNPAHGLVNVTWKTESATVELYDMKGTLLDRKKVQGSSTSFSINELPSGLYYIRLKEASGTVGNMKFTKM